MPKDSVTPQDKQGLLNIIGPDVNPWVDLGLKIGVEALEAVFFEFGGMKPHVPSSDNFWAKLRRKLRDDQIRASFNGRNFNELRLEYALSVRQLRNIVNHHGVQRHRSVEHQKPVKVSDAYHADILAIAKREGLGVHEVADRLIEFGISNNLYQSSPVESA